MEQSYLIHFNWFNDFIVNIKRSNLFPISRRFCQRRLPRSSGFSSTKARYTTSLWPRSKLTRFRSTFILAENGVFDQRVFCPKMGFERFFFVPQWVIIEIKYLFDSLNSRKLNWTLSHNRHFLKRGALSVEILFASVYVKLF